MIKTTETAAPALRETLASWVSRRAAQFWTDAASFCLDKGTSMTAVLRSPDEAIAAFGALGEAVPDGLVQWSPRACGSGRRALRGHGFPTKSLQPPAMRGCPQCLREDAAAGPGGMAMRGSWLVPHVSLCLRHGMPLVPLWREAEPLKRFDSAPFLARLAPEVLSGQHDVPTRKALEFDLWIEARLSGSGFGPTWLDAHPLHAAATFCRLLGTALLRLEDIPPSRVTPEDDPLLREMGFRVARHGEDAILGAFAALQRKPGSPHDGARAIFPQLHDRLAYDYRDDPDYAPFRDLLRQHMAATWPLGPGDTLLGEPVRTRRMHSVRTAARATGIDQRRLRKALAAAGVLQATGLPDAWSVFDAEAAAPVLATLTELVPARQFAALIGATRSQFDLLVADGVLAPRLEGAEVKAVWHPDQGRDFLDSILAGAQPLRQAQHGWEHISASAQRLKVGPGAIIAAIRDGRITRIGNRMEREGYAAVHVYHDEVAAALRPDPVDAKSIEVFAKSVGIGQPSILKRLVDDGHVRTTRMRNPVTRAQQAYFTPGDEAAFHARFLTPRTLSKTFGQSWQKLTSQLRAASVEPFGGRARPYGNVYLRSEVEAAFEEPPADVASRGDVGA